MDKKDVVYWVSFLYGLACLTPSNAILSTLDFYEAAMPNYPISFVVSFAINGVMVLVVLICIVFPEVGTHSVKVSLMILFTSVQMILMPFLTDFSADRLGEKACFWITLGNFLLLGVITAIT